MKDISIKHDPKEKTFYAHMDESKQAQLDYERPERKIFDFNHIFVPKKFRNTGLADQITRFALEFVESKNYQMIASCPFVRKYLDRNPAFKKLLVDNYEDPFMKN